MGEHVNFSCQALGNGSSISWLKNGQIVSGNKTLPLPIKKQKGFVINENILTLKSATKAEQGNYTCKVTSGLQPKWQHQRTVELIVNSKLSLYISICISTSTPTSTSISISVSISVSISISISISISVIV